MMGPMTRLFATPVWLQHDNVSVLLPSNASMAIDGNARTTVISRYRERFADQPVFIVADKGELPAGIDPASVEAVDRFDVTLPMWEEATQATRVILGSEAGLLPID